MMRRINSLDWKVLLLLGAVSGGIGWLLIPLSWDYRRRVIAPGERWIAGLLESRNALAVDRVAYLGGHPSVPVPTEAALFLQESQLHVELRSGGFFDIPYLSIGEMQVSSQEHRGMLVTQKLAGVYLTNEFLNSTTFILEMEFVDDKGLKNVLRLGGGKIIGVEQISNLIVSGRYHAIPAMSVAPTAIDASAAPTSSERAELTQRLVHLRELRDKGLITEDEFETKRRGIVEGL